jgi:hypothetical protein
MGGNVFVGTACMLVAALASALFVVCGHAEAAEYLLTPSQGPRAAMYSNQHAYCIAFIANSKDADSYHARDCELFALN